MIELLFARIASPLGTLLVVAGPQILYALDFAEFEDRMLQRLRQRLGGFLLIQAANPLACRDRLQAYFAGEVDCLNSIPVDPAGTPFQQQVWSALRAIPAGATLSYGQLAAQLGRPTASRAVGMANAQNPIAIVIPCHRVIGVKGQLTGYSGGCDRKRWLLQHEAASLKEFRLFGK